MPRVLMGDKAVEMPVYGGGPFVRKLRPPICCIMGQKDSGKTKLLDSMRGYYDRNPISRRSSTFFQAEYIKERTKGVVTIDLPFTLPGILIADITSTRSDPSLRLRALRLCDVAVLVIDIDVGVDEEIVSLVELSTLFHKDFIVVVNKVDKFPGWKTCPNTPFLKALSQQSTEVRSELISRMKQVNAQVMKAGAETVRIIPTSTVSGEGIANVLFSLYYRTQKTMVDKLIVTDEIQCSTDDVVVINSVLVEGEKAMCGFQGPISAILQALFELKKMKLIPA